MQTAYFSNGTEIPSTTLEVCVSHLTSHKVSRASEMRGFLALCEILYTLPEITEIKTGNCEIR